jgi:hypothetical protein
MVSFLSACGGGSGGENSVVNSKSVDTSAIADNLGGLLEHKDSLKVEMPEGTVDDEVDILTIIDPLGGFLEHEDGVKVEVPEGAVNGEVEFSITKVELPQILPGGIMANSGAYRIESDAGEFILPVRVTLPLSDENLTADNGVLGIYEWDGQRWYYAGGDVEDSVISTDVNGFSIFTIGTGESLHRLFEFRNTIGYNCTVYVDSYRLAHPEIDAPLTGDWGVAVFVPPFDHHTARGVYPQGSYRFCAEYWVDDGFPEDQGWHHVFIGMDDPNLTYSLNENSSDIVPTLVQFDTLNRENPGICPGIRNVGTDPGANPDGTPITVSGTWRVYLRCAGSAEDAVVFEVDIIQSGDNFTGSGSGEDYDGTPLNVTLQGAYFTYGNQISGTLTIRSESRPDRIDGFTVTLLNDTGYVPTSNDNSSTGCDKEARFLKIE